MSLTTLAGLRLLFRPLVIESLDPGFLRGVSRWSALSHHGFLVLVVLNLVAGFQALGTLMSVGLMMLPAIASRLWAVSVGGMLVVAFAIAALSGIGGLLLSYHYELPSGPAIILLAGLFYLFSLLFASQGGLLPRLVRARHFTN